MIDPAADGDLRSPGGPTAREYRGAADLAKLLDAAREHASDDEHQRTALALLNAYRDRVLEAGRPELMFEVFPVVERLANGWYSHDAGQFLETTQRLLAPWPPQAADFSRTLRKFQAAELEAEAEDDRKEITEQFEEFEAYVALVILVAAGVATVGLLTLGLGLGFPHIVSRTMQFVAAAVGGLGVVVATVAFLVDRIGRAYVQGQLRDLERKVEIHAALAGTEGLAGSGSGVQPAGAEYFGNLVRINVSNLSDYYTQVRVHTNNSFWASIVAGGLGFVLVCIGVGYGFAGADDKTVSYVAAGSGIIVEFISGVFFYLYNRTVRQLKGYHDSLLDVQNILLSFRIVEESTEEHRGRLLQDILSFLLQKRAQESGRPEKERPD